MQQWGWQSDWVHVFTNVLLLLLLSFPFLLRLLHSATREKEAFVELLPCVPSTCIRLVTMAPAGIVQLWMQKTSNFSPTVHANLGFVSLKTHFQQRFWLQGGRILWHVAAWTPEMQHNWFCWHRFDLFVSFYWGGRIFYLKKKVDFSVKCVNSSSGSDSPVFTHYYQSNRFGIDLCAVTVTVSAAVDATSVIVVVPSFHRFRITGELSKDMNCCFVTGCCGKWTAGVTAGRRELRNQHGQPLGHAPASVSSQSRSRFTLCVPQTWSTAPMSWTSASHIWQTRCWSAQRATAGLWFSKHSSPHTTSWCTATRWAKLCFKMSYYYKKVIIFIAIYKVFLD